MRVSPRSATVAGADDRDIDGATPQRLATLLDGGGLVLHYQPIVDAESGAVRALETLARWRPADGKLRGAGWLFGRIGGDADLLRDVEVSERRAA